MSDPKPIKDGAVLIVDGVIRQVGLSYRVERLREARDAIDIDASGKVVMPGFVDCCTRLLGPFVRPEELDHPTGGFPSLSDAVGAMRALTAQRLTMEVRSRLRHFVRSGTLTLDARCGYGLDEVSEVRALRAALSIQDRPLYLCPTFAGAAWIPDEATEKAYTNWLIGEALPEVRRQSLAEWVEVGCGPGAFSAGAVEFLLRRAAALDLRTRVRTGGKEVPVAASCGARVVEGLEEAGTAEARTVAASRMIAVVSPAEVFFRGSSSYAPARALIDAGGAVALASGYDLCRAPSPNLQFAVALACTQMKMTPGEAITAATINAAYALGVGEQVGSLESGKRGDVLIVNVPDYREIPLHVGVTLVAMCIRGGQEIFPRIEAPPTPPA